MCIKSVKFYLATCVKINNTSKTKILYVKAQQIYILYTISSIELKHGKISSMVSEFKKKNTFIIIYLYLWQYNFKWVQKIFTRVDTENESVKSKTVVF